MALVGWLDRWPWFRATIGIALVAGFLQLFAEWKRVLRARSGKSPLKANLVSIMGMPEEYDQRLDVRLQLAGFFGALLGYIFGIDIVLRDFPAPMISDLGTP